MQKEQALRERKMVSLILMTSKKDTKTKKQAFTAKLMEFLFNLGKVSGFGPSSYWG